MFSGYIEGWAREAVGWRELGAEEEGKEQLGLASAAATCLVFVIQVYRRLASQASKVWCIPLASNLGNIPRGDTTA